MFLILCRLCTCISCGSCAVVWLAPDVDTIAEACLSRKLVQLHDGCLERPEEKHQWPVCLTGQCKTILHRMRGVRGNVGRKGHMQCSTSQCICPTTAIVQLHQTATAHLKWGEYGAQYACASRAGINPVSTAASDRSSEHQCDRPRHSGGPCSTLQHALPSPTRRACTCALHTPPKHNQTQK